jgi:hypothetical protein
MTHQRLQSNNVATALPEETIGEAMPELVRGEGPERRAAFERIIALRDEIGPIDFDVSQALRELREDA